LTSALDGVCGQSHAPAALYQEGKTPSTHWIEGWVSLRSGLDTEARGKISSQNVLHLCCFSFSGLTLTR
jgi:hypothetical protein